MDGSPGRLQLSQDNPFTIRDGSHTDTNRPLLYLHTDRQRPQALDGDIKPDAFSGHLISLFLTFISLFLNFISVKPLPSCLTNPTYQTPLPLPINPHHRLLSPYSCPPTTRIVSMLPLPRQIPWPACIVSCHAGVSFDVKCLR
jgi:hypothetical protein